MFRSIAFFGSSSVYGSNDFIECGYVQRIRKSIDSRQQKTTIYQLGILGETTSKLVQRIDNEVIARNPELVIVQAGSNDTARHKFSHAPNNVDQSIFKINCEDIAKIVTSHCRFAFISSTPVDEDRNPQDGDMYYLNEQIAQYGSILKEMSESLSIPFLDVYTVFKTSENLPEYWSYDGLHLNDKGHSYLQKLVEDFIDTI